MRNLNIITRKAERKYCRIFGKVRYLNNEVDVRILDLSITGVALEIRTPLHAASGSRVQIVAEDLGTLYGIIRWSHNGRLGIEFDPNSNSRAQVASYFRFFHKEVRPVLKR
ncbi:PilZ domain-containing protein [Rhizobium sullae]|uniref:PilZ domain-containing protein n=1 Tax=Rhizobium sullae TaxID=50338 RepID=A0A2N0DAA8_RHISU|nr:PilZ domain-containing protein [Rhizobium sullae]PKA43019.1 PilZ domain-containing protein [Rhizobium sullae]UWU15530.1 PilZ domain-containing protein [Rhizobium sullae]